MAGQEREARGQVIVIFALALVALVAAVGLVLDGGATFAQRRDQQSAADLAALAAAMCSRHVGRCPGFIDEDEPVPIELALAFTPGFPPRQDIRAILLCGMGGLFLRVMLWRSKKRRIVP